MRVYRALALNGVALLALAAASCQFQPPAVVGKWRYAGGGPVIVGGPGSNLREPIEFLEDGTLKATALDYTPPLHDYKIALWTDARGEMRGWSPPEGKHTKASWSPDGEDGAEAVLHLPSGDTMIATFKLDIDRQGNEVLRMTSRSRGTLTHASQKMMAGTFVRVK
jgi:hypothetical protein